MRFHIRTVLVLLVAVAVVGAQQPNTFQASMQVNGVAGPPYPITNVSLPRGLAQSVVISTQTPNAPFVLFGAGSLYPVGQPVLGGQLLDVDINGGYFVLLDGIAQPSVFNTGPTGTFNSSVVLSATATIGTQAAFQTLVADPSVTQYASRLTAATQVVVAQGLTVIPISTVNNGGALFDFVPYGMTYPYYSNVWTRMFVNTDGNVTFGSASGDFTPTPTEFRTQQPRIAPFWTDLDQGFPGASIQVTVDQSGLTPFPTVTVDWINMAEWSNSGARHTFQLTLNMITGDIRMVHDPFNVAMVYDQLMGISPGGNIVPVGGWPAQFNLSTLTAAPYTGAVNEAFWEWFGLTNMTYYTAGFNNPWDMIGTTTDFLAIGAGATNQAYYYACGH